MILLDGPQGWRAEVSQHPDMRECERLTRTPGKTGLPTVMKPRSWTRMAEFSIAVFDALQAAGWARFPGACDGDRYAVETFPTHAWRALGLTSLPGRNRRGIVVDRWVSALDRVSSLSWSRFPSHDDLQAAVAGLAGLAMTTRYDAIGFDAQGRPPLQEAGIWREGVIVSPTRRP